MSDKEVLLEAASLHFEEIDSNDPISIRRSIHAGRYFCSHHRRRRDGVHPDPELHRSWNKRAMRYSVLVVLACTVVVPACIQGKSEECIRRAAHEYLSTTPEDLRIISASALMQHMDSGSVRDMRIVDTRSRDEYDASHIPGSTHVPFKAAAEKETLARLPKDRILVLVCKSGHTASMLNAVLNMLGYRAVTLKDGMKGWAEVNGPLAAGADRSGT